MKRFALAMLLTSFVVAVQAGQDATKDDVKKLQGAWVTISCEARSEKLSEEQLKETTMIIEGDKHTVTRGKVSIGGTHKLNATKNPKEIDAIGTDEPTKEPMLGIYKLEGDLLTVCFAPHGKERPKEFSIKSGTGEFVHVWKREKK